MLIKTNLLLVARCRFLSIIQKNIGEQDVKFCLAMEDNGTWIIGPKIIAIIGHLLYMAVIVWGYNQEY